MYTQQMICHHLNMFDLDIQQEGKTQNVKVLIFH